MACASQASQRNGKHMHYQRQMLRTFDSFGNEPAATH